jgi:hypothetical protein
MMVRAIILKYVLNQMAGLGTCAINPAPMRSAKSWMAERRSLWERRLDRLGSYLADASSASPHYPGSNLTQQSDEPEENQ